MKLFLDSLIPSQPPKSKSKRAPAVRKNAKSAGNGSRNRSNTSIVPAQTISNNLQSEWDDLLFMDQGNPPFANQNILDSQFNGMPSTFSFDLAPNMKSSQHLTISNCQIMDATAPFQNQNYVNSNGMYNNEIMESLLRGQMMQQGSSYNGTAMNQNYALPLNLQTFAGALSYIQPQNGLAMNNQQQKFFPNESLVSDLDLDWSLLEGSVAPNLLSTTSPTIFMEPANNDLFSDVDFNNGNKIDSSAPLISNHTVLSTDLQAQLDFLTSANISQTQNIDNVCQIPSPNQPQAVPVKKPFKKKSNLKSDKTPHISKFNEPMSDLGIIPSEADINDFFSLPEFGIVNNDALEAKLGEMSKNHTASNCSSPHSEMSDYTDSESIIDDMRPYDISSPQTEIASDEDDEQNEEIPRDEVDELFQESVDATTNDDLTSMGLGAISNDIDWVSTPAHGFSVNQIEMIKSQLRQSVQLTIQSYVILSEVEGPDHPNTQYSRSHLVYSTLL